MSMKWGGVFLVLMLFATVSYAAVCPPVVGDPFTGSNLGRGGVQICGINYMCGAYDGICPEEFNQTSNRTASCSGCPDPDCQGYVNGTVYDNSTGSPVPLQGANVSLFFGAEVSYFTGVDGTYEMYLPSGLHTVGASKRGYDTQVKEVYVNNIVTMGYGPSVDFYLPLGVCHADCTNEFNRCNPSCEGFSVINASGSLDACTFDPEVIQECTNKIAGTEVYLGYLNETHSWYANCCEGSKYAKFNPKPQFSCEGQRGFVKTERIVQFQGKPVKLVVAVCK